MIVFFTGFLASAYAVLAGRAADPLGFFREPDPAVPTLWRQVLRGLAWLAVLFAFLLTLYLVLSAATADNIVGRDGILGRLLTSLDGVVLGVFEVVGRLIPDIEVTL